MLHHQALFWADETRLHGAMLLWLHSQTKMGERTYQKTAEGFDIFDTTSRAGVIGFEFGFIDVFFCSGTGWFLLSDI